MAVLMAIKEAAEMVIELIRKEQIEVTNQGKNGMAKALLRNTLFRAY
ncbi:hypothetical protein Goshw_028026 [Gossypium schwendimanii]|uniref:Uncharacterized protein n=1 Tax=Gossypium schwendimanii TaxID=34291 RepID=A0A7J9ME97_GOSSC|nr:hypothetical protein [Gossypium schwendimanii]